MSRHAPPLPIVHLDERIAVVDKPSGLVVHRSAMASDRVNCMTILRRQLHRHVWPVHRLDRGASGLLVFGLDSGAARDVAEAIAGRSVEKRYLVAVRGWPAEHGTIERALEDEGKVFEASTAFRRLATSEIDRRTGPRHATSRFALCEVVPHTGRWHQIRRHFAGAGWPVVGDNQHGDHLQNRALREELGVARLMLHASRLVLPHDGAILVLDAPMPADMLAALARLGVDYSTPSTSSRSDNT